MGMLPLTTPISTDDVDLSKYGLGTQRTLADYTAACGVDFFNRQITNKARLGNLHASEFVDPVLDMVLKSLGSVER
jgi:hypothetical protein